MVNKNVWVTTKREIGGAKEEVLRLDSQVAVLNKCNDRLEHECNELKVTMSKMRIEDREVIIE